MLVSAFSFFGSGVMPFVDIISLKNGTDVHLNWHLSLLSFIFSFLHSCSTLHSLLSWSSPSHLQLTIKIPSAWQKCLLAA